MEFHEKLQELRKNKGLTQEELAQKLYVSRTAISKWESGRGYPNIESLKSIASFFQISLDELLSSDAVLTIAEEEQKQRQNAFQDRIFGLLDLCMAMLLFMPFFADRTQETLRGSSLLMLSHPHPSLKSFYCLLVLASVTLGVLTLSFHTLQIHVWKKEKTAASLSISLLSGLLFTLGLHPYAAVFSFALLTVKVLMLLKQQ